MEELEVEILESMVSNTGKNVITLSHESPIMLVFLRHFGCTFCRAALAELSKKRNELEANGTRLVFVHMADDATADEYFAKYEIENPIYISDNQCRYYEHFGLVKGNFKQLFGLNTWIRGFQEGVINGHGIGKQLGDGFQMPGVFLLFKGEIKDRYIHKFASDKPDYEKLTECCII